MVSSASHHSFSSIPHCMTLLASAYFLYALEVEQILYLFFLFYQGLSSFFLLMLISTNSKYASFGLAIVYLFSFRAPLSFAITIIKRIVE